MQILDMAPAAMRSFSHFKERDRVRYFLYDEDPSVRHLTQVTDFYEAVVEDIRATELKIVFDDPGAARIPLCGPTMQVGIRSPWIMSEKDFLMLRYSSEDHEFWHAWFMCEDGGIRTDSVAISRFRAALQEWSLVKMSMRNTQAA